MLAFSILAAGSRLAFAQQCTGFPWTVTAVPAGGKSVSVGICGLFAGCRPHDPRFTVRGSEIRVYLTQAELPDCICLAVEDNFRQTVLVSPVEPGTYTVRVVDVSCGVSTDAGSADLVFGASTAIPTVGRGGLAALAVLTALAAVALLRS